MPFDLQAARADGYTDDEIAGFLAPQLGFDLKKAKADGWEPTAIAEHLASLKPKQPAPRVPIPDIAPAPAGGDAMDTANDMEGQVNAPAAAAPEAPDESLGTGDEATRMGRIEKASSASAYKGLGGLLDAFWGMAQSSERKNDGGRTMSDAVMESTPMVGPAMKGLQDAARILMPKDEKGKVKRLELAEQLDDASDAMQPQLMKESFDDAASKGHVLEWMVTQAAGQSSQIATMLASILFPPLAPATLPMMGITAGGNQYAENVKAGVPQEKAALDATVNGLVEIASEAVGYKIGTGAGAIYERVLSKIPEDMRAAAASSIMAKVASGAATLAGAGITEGTSEASGQVVQDLSQKYIAGRDPGDMGENARTAFFASILPGAIFASPHTVAHAIDTPERQLERHLDEALKGEWLVDAKTVAADRLNPEGAQLERRTASSVDLTGNLDRDLEAILDAPITKLPAAPESAAIDKDLEEVGLSSAAPAFNFKTSFPEPLEGSSIDADQNAQAHGEVIDALRAATDEGNDEMYGHILDAYRSAFGDTAAQQLDQQVKGGNFDGRSTLQADSGAGAGRNEGAAASQDASAGAEGPAGQAVLGPEGAAPVEGAAAGKSGENSGESPEKAGNSPAEPVGGPDKATNLQGEKSERGAGAEKEEAGIEDYSRRGQLKTFATKKEAELFKASNRVPKNFSPRKEAAGDWRLSRPQRVRTEAQKANDKRTAERARENARIKPTDSLATMIGKLGGIQATELERDGADIEDMKQLRTGVVGRPFYRRKGGLTLEQLAEALVEHGFDLHDEHGAVDSTKLRDLISEELAGNPQFTPEGHEARAAMADEEREKERLERERELTPDELAAAGFDDLSPEEQDAVATTLEEGEDDILDRPGKTFSGPVTDEELDEIFGPSSGKAAKPDSRAEGEGAAHGQGDQGGSSQEAPAQDLRKIRDGNERRKAAVIAEVRDRLKQDGIVVARRGVSDYRIALTNRPDGKGVRVTSFFGDEPTGHRDYAAVDNGSPINSAYTEFTGLDLEFEDGHAGETDATITAPEHKGNRGKPLDESAKYEFTADGQPVERESTINTEGVDLLTMDPKAFRQVTDEWAALIAPPDQRVQMAKQAGPFIKTSEAAKRVEEWKAEAKRQGKDNRSINSDKTILSLFDFTGQWSQPWRDAGYNVLMFDVQHDERFGNVHNFSVEFFTENFDISDVDGILIAVPCTDFSSSGARHFAKKDADGRTEASKELVFQSMSTVEYFRPRFWALENPVGRIERLTGIPPARLTFDPNQFGAPYTKKTMLYGKFETDLPTANVKPTEGSKMHSQYGGSSMATKNARSETPEGFAYAFFMANNWEAVGAEKRLGYLYPDASGAVRQALAAGMTEARIHELMDEANYDPGDANNEEARNLLLREVAKIKKAGGAGGGAKFSRGEKQGDLLGGAEETDAQAKLRRERERRLALEKKQKEQAPPPEDFGLTGSDSAVDKARAKGQDELFQNKADYVAVHQPGAESFGLKSPSGQLDLFSSAAPAQGEPKLHRIFATVIEPAQRGQLRIGVERVTNPVEAAHVFSHLRKEPREYFQVLVLDKDQKPIAYLDLFRGAQSQTSVYPGIVASELAATPGARSFWLSHNHPSGLTEPSFADQSLTRQLAEVFAGTGYEYAGHVIVGAKGFTHLEGMLNGGERNQPYQLFTRKFTVPIMERRAKKQGKLMDSQQIISPRTAREAVTALAGDKEGLILLDTQNRPVGFLEQNLAALGTLRTGDPKTGFGALTRDLTRAGAAGIIAVRQGGMDPATSAGLGNLRDFAQSLDMKVLDTVYGGQAGWNSAAERGTEPSGNGIFMSRREGVESGHGQESTRRAAGASPEGDQNLRRTVGGGRAQPGWAESTRISREGRPVAVHRGGRGNVLAPENFGADALGKATGHPSSGLGVFFTISKDEASRYGTVTSYNLDLRNPAIVKADELPPFDTIGEAVMYREKLRREGHDGIIITARHLGGGVNIVAFEPEQVLPIEAAKASRAQMKMGSAVETELAGAQVDDVVKKLGVQAKVVGPVEELPQHLLDQVKAEGAERDVRGMYDPATGAIFIVRNNIRDEAEAAFVTLHEAAHRGLEAIFGSDLRPVLGQIYLGNENVRRAANAMMAKYGYSQSRATEEVIADLAQKGSARDLKGWEHFVAFIRKWLVAHGFNIRVSDEMVEFIAGAAARAGREEGRPTMTRDVPMRAASSARFTRAQEGTPEFRKWFAGSKVVDAKGNPLVVYHGRDVDFGVFRRTEDIGFHFGTLPQAQSRMMTEERGRWDDGANAMPVYLRIENPLRMDDLHTWDPKDVLGELERRGIITEAEYPDNGIVDRAYVQRALKAKGYDGIVYHNETEGSGDSYIVFSPNQVKSSIGNSGAFSARNPDVRFSRRDVTTPAFRNWFADSKVVDAKGEPLEVFHGTRYDGNELRPQLRDLGVHFGQVFQANAPAFVGRGYSTGRLTRKAEGANVMPVYLRIENPLKLKDTFGPYAVHIQRTLDQLQNTGILNRAENHEIFNSVAGPYENRPTARRAAWAKIQSAIEDAGYDGVIYRNVHETDKGAVPIPENWRKHIELEPLPHGSFAARLRVPGTRPIHLAGGPTEQEARAGAEARFAAMMAGEDPYKKLKGLDAVGDSYIVFHPQQVKSAIGNRGTFDPYDPDVRFSRRDADDGGHAPAPVYFSALANAVRDVKTKSAPAGQWAATLKNMKGVKSDELNWTGVLDWLEGLGKESVPREAVEKFLDENGVQVREVQMGQQDHEGFEADDVDHGDDDGGDIVDGLDHATGEPPAIAEVRRHAIQALTAEYQEFQRTAVYADNLGDAEEARIELASEISSLEHNDDEVPEAMRSEYQYLSTFGRRWDAAMDSRVSDFYRMELDLKGYTVGLSDGSEYVYGVENRNEDDRVYVNEADNTNPAETDSFDALPVEVQALIAQMNEALTAEAETDHGNDGQPRSREEQAKQQGAKDRDLTRQPPADQVTDSPKFPTWLAVRGGGEDYRELLLTMPVRYKKAVPMSLEHMKQSGYTATVEHREGTNQTNYVIRRNGTMMSQRSGARGLLTEDQALETFAKGVAEESAEAGSVFNQSHWREPNVLAHVRFDSRRDAEGKRVLFLQEIQSDWAQKGRKLGFRHDSEAKRLSEEHDKATDETLSAWVKARRVLSQSVGDEGADGLGNQLFMLAKGSGVNVVDEHLDRWPVEKREVVKDYLRAALKEDELERKLSSANRAIPAGPFVQKTEAWTGLAVKRMIRYAVDHGYDRVAWATGAQQNKLYNIGSHVHAIQWEPRALSGGTGRHIAMHTSSGDTLVLDVGLAPEGVVISGPQEAMGQPLAAVVGEEIAHKIMANGAGALSGLDLETGGEGQKASYDKIVPNVVNDILKKNGGGKVVVNRLAPEARYFVQPSPDAGHSAQFQVFEQMERDGTVRRVGGPQLTKEDAEEVAERMRAKVPQGSEQMGFDITPELAERARGGFALFSRKSTGNATLDSFDEKAGLRPNEATLAERMKAFASQPWADVRQGMKQSYLDRFHGIKQAEARLGNLPAEQSGYVSARLSTGVPSVMRYLMLYGQVAWKDGILQPKEGAKGLLEVFKPVREDFDSFIRWMVAKRAERLLGDSKERNFTKAEIRAALDASKEHEERYKAVAREFAQFKRSVLDVAENAGLIDATTRPSWDQADWIPFYRVIDGDLVKGPGGKRGLSGQSSGIRMLKGGEASLNDPLENMILNFSHLIDASMKNRALAQVIENLAGDKDVMEKVGMRMAPALVPLSQIKKVLAEQGVPEDVIEAIPQEALTGIQKMWSIVPPSDPDVVRVMKGGRAEYWQVHDPLLLRALTAVQGSGQQWTRYLRPFKTILTRTVTAAPDFMVRNFIRDSTQSAVIDKNGMIPVIDSVHGLAKSLAKEGGMLDMMAAGASFAGGYTFGTDPEATAQAIRRSLRAKGWAASRIDGFMGTMIDQPTKLLELWEEIGSAVENANREAVFESANRTGKSRAEAIYEAKDLMDYSMMGDSQMIAMLNDLLPFFNARLQGLYKLQREGALRPGPVIAKGLVLTLATLAMLAANWDRDKYEELEDWDKDTYWHIWVMGKHFRIPKPFELGFIFATVPERIARMIGGRETVGEGMKHILIGIRDQLAMNPTPQFAAPIVEAVANQDFFTGRPIEGMSDEGKLPHARYNERTSETMRAVSQGLSYVPMPLANNNVADATGMSPKQLEHLWTGYLGTVGTYALGLSDMAVRKMTGAPAQPALRLDDIPVVKSFIREDPARGTRFKTELYNLRKQADQAFSTVNAMIGEGNAPAALEESQRNQKRLMARGPLDAGASVMNDLGKAIDMVTRDRNLTPEEKLRQIDTMIGQQNQVAEQTVRAVKPILQ